MGLNLGLQQTLLETLNNGWNTILDTRIFHPELSTHAVPTFSAKELQQGQHREA